ncbi:MAG: hypothetical protein FJ398_26285 [Verrucomicrobia bacterium]|nr:hypothetical protein [Verrucomicrobiota bacterium]
MSRWNKQQSARVLDCTLLFLGSTVLCFLLGNVVHRWLVRKNIIDRPNERSSHSQPTVRGGGVAIVLSLLIVGSFLLFRAFSNPLFVILTAATILAAVSFLDDLKSLPSSLRFTCHAAAAVAVLFALGGQWSVVFGLDFSPLLFALCSLLALLCLTGYTNAFNFMDGINGLAAGQTAITGLGMALLTSVASCQLPVVSHPLPTPAPSISAKALTSDAPTSDNWQLASTDL